MRQPASGLFGANRPPMMSLIPLMRPFNSSSEAARPMSSPPICSLTGVKVSTTTSFSRYGPSPFTGRTLAGRGLLVALVVLVAPGDELSQGAQVVVRTADPDDQVRDAVLDVAVSVSHQVRPEVDGALYLLRVAPDLLAPVVENAVLAARPLRVGEAVPDVGVLGNDTQRHLLPTAPDQDRYLASGWRVEPGQSVLDDRHRGVEMTEPVTRRPELVAVLVVVPLEPAGAYPEDEPAAGDVVHRARHVREQISVPVRVAGN